MTRSPAPRRSALTRLIFPAAVAIALVAVAVQPAAAATKRPLPRKAAAPPIVGIADQHSNLFFDPLFSQAGITHSRLLVGWNGIYKDAERANMDAYLTVAHALNIDVLVTFGNAWGEGRNRPTPAAFVQAFRRVRERYPWVTEFATWNEPNLQGASPELTASYWRALRRECRSCTILAADMVDTPTMAKWIKRFRRVSRREPQFWGLHNYVDANTFRSTGTRGILKATKGEVWLTETGGVVERHNASKISFATGTDHAAQAVRYIFGRLVPLNRRIRRVYLYNWRATPGATTWDSALLNADGTPRAAYTALREQLARYAATPQRNAAKPLTVVPPRRPGGVVEAKR